MPDLAVRVLCGVPPLRSGGAGSATGFSEHKKSYLPFPPLQLTTFGRGDARVPDGRH